jgi:hypothetical protein
MDALAAVGPKKGLVGLLVMPGFVRGACLHRTEDVHEARGRAPRSQNVLDTIFFAHRLGAAQKLDPDTGRLSLLLGVRADPVAQTLGELRKIEDLDVAHTQITRGYLGVAEVRQRAGDDDTVEAAELTADLPLIAFREQHLPSHRNSTPIPGGNRFRSRCKPCLVPATPA